MARKNAKRVGLSTEIVVLLDRSGSMETIKGDMEGGFNGFIADQQKHPSACRVTLAQFDTHSTDIVYEAKPLADVPALKLEPRGGTPLLDAMGKIIGQVTDRLALTKGPARPDRVLFLVITDGEENASHQFTKEQIRTLVKERTDDGWAFSFLGANVDAFAEAGSLGVAAAATANYVPDAAGVKHAYAAVAMAASGFRSGATYTVTNQDTRVSQHQRSAAQTMGQLGGRKGGIARAQSLTPDQRSSQASHAAKARWKKADDVE